MNHRAPVLKNGGLKKPSLYLVYLVWLDVFLGEYSYGGFPISKPTIKDDFLLTPMRRQALQCRSRRGSWRSHQCTKVLRRMGGQDPRSSHRNHPCETRVHNSRTCWRLWSNYTLELSIGNGCLEAGTCISNRKYRGIETS
jgi:hypothetical protein